MSAFSMRSQHTWRCEMEKISGIIPQNARLASVDMEHARPVRPGVPAFGRPVGKSELADKVTLSSLRKESSVEDFQTYRNPVESRRAKLVEDISNKFFMTKPNPAPQEPKTSEPTLVENEDDNLSEVNEVELREAEGGEISGNKLEEDGTLVQTPVKFQKPIQVKNPYLNPQKAL